MRRFRVLDEMAGKRLDSVLAALSGMSRSQVAKAVKEGRVWLDGDEEPTAKTLVTTGVGIGIEDAVIEEIAAAPDLAILYEDEDMLAIDKPAGLAVHLSETGRQQPTVAGFALAHGVVDDDLDRPGIVHRLDKDTSGVMLVAKHPEAKAYLQKLFKSRDIDKTYIALVRGQMQPDEAVIRLPIGRDRKAPIKRAVVPGSREAQTQYVVKRRYSGASLLEIKLHTGRTHQIRVHFAHLGHPVIGDTLYGEPQRPAGLTRQFLHAASIALTTLQGTHATITSKLTPELLSYLAGLENQV